LFLPAAPTGLTVTGSNAQAALSWTAPTGVISQAPITDYREQFSSDGGTNWTTFTAAASTAATATVTGLTNGTAYVFRVAAINGVGAGAYTLASSSVTPIAGTPPNAPTSLTATAGNAQIALSWTAPSAPGTSAISGYTVEYTPSGGSAQTVSTGSTGTSYTLTGLTNGTSYTARVAAVNAAGTGTYTAASSSVTPAAGDPLFSNVQLLLRADSLADSSSYARTVTASGASISTATKKYGSGSFAISGSGQYIAVAGSSALNMSGDFCIEWWQNLASATAQGWLIGGNANSSGYFMMGVNLTGAGQLWIGEANVGWPVQFNGISLTSNQWQHIAISRTGSTNRLYIDGTRVGTVTDSNSWVVNPNSIWIGSQAAGTSINGFIDELRWTVGNNRSYTGDTLQVPSAAFPDGAMSAPTSLAATAGNAQVSLTWTAPAYNGGSAITDYSVQYSSNSGSTWTAFSRTASTTASQVVTGLTNGTAYVFRVAGINSNGTGTYTAASSSVTPAVSSSATVTGGTVATPGDGYTYRTFTSSGDLVISGASLTCDVLVVGGGGPGSWGRSGGGGGGGGVLHAINQSIAAGSYPITVAGTTTRSGYPNATSNGGPSSIAAIYVATGGSGGIVYGNYRHRGGTSGFPTTTSNSAGNAGGFGYGESDSVDPDGGGSGGGAGGAGQNARNWESAPGGAGRTVFGTVYGRGGRGGAEGLDAREDGTANRGQGGSGSQSYSTNTSGNGGSGVVIIRYAVA
jgi:hypothetical protein